MNSTVDPFLKLLETDRRYRLEAYQFVSEALSHAQRRMSKKTTGKSGACRTPPKGDERHMNGPQLCHAIRELAIEQYGLMARAVLRRWGVTSTGDFGEIVYNLIEVGKMKKSNTDRREDFDNVYDFDDVFSKHFRMTRTMEACED